jgi:hypothetical protein
VQRTATRNSPRGPAGSTERLPADELGDFVSGLAHRIAAFPAAGQVAVKDRVNAIALVPAAEFRRDSDLFDEGCPIPTRSA